MDLNYNRYNIHTGHHSQTNKKHTPRFLSLEFLTSKAPQIPKHYMLFPIVFVILQNFMKIHPI